MVTLETVNMLSYKDEHSTGKQKSNNEKQAVSLLEDLEGGKERILETR